MRFFQFFTFDIVKSKKAFRRDLFEPEKELPQLPESNNYDEQFLSFFENIFELACLKKDGTATIYRAETMAKHEGFLLGRIADNRTKHTTNEKFEPEKHDDHPYCHFIVDPRHHLLAIERGTAFNYRPEKVAEIFQEAFGHQTGRPLQIGHPNPDLGGRQRFTVLAHCPPYHQGAQRQRDHLET